MRSPARVFAAAATLAVLVACASCGGGDDARRPAATDEPAPEPAASGPSIYGLDLPLTDQDGHALVLSDLRGRVWVAAMMYGNCKTVCPRVTEDMKAIEGRLAGAERDGVGFVLFSLDPGRDTPAALREFARSHGLDAARWRLLAASEEGVRDLAAVLGVKYKAEEGGEIAHSAMIFVIDRDGVVTHRQVGVNQDAGELIDAVSAARR
jgi:protein SCO1/2